MIHTRQQKVCHAFRIFSHFLPVHEDPFDFNEPNPTLSNAIDSSLWELHTHKEHYHSAVSTLAKIFEEAFTKPNYALEDFLDHTYTTVRSHP